ncbi:DUF202 domain-containing protein [Actinokineospora globicatena]|uniref:DUF202 domain-containing protein n=1 Tax=Actinokineospora globicatena TaxID=103729 RepID=A0A9W6V8F8_9PSEU|nr:DUF202 domain-containing protein [Actinokineospora globicatena]GLW93905.1 hypothetical protein Aglo03_47210 [Actinokineospora globicatena]
MTAPDRGLQAERTRLAWTRTGLACAAVGALLLHGARTPVALVAGLLVLLCAAGMVLCGARRYRGRVRELAGWVGLVAVVPGALAVVALLVGSRG